MKRLRLRLRSLFRQRELEQELNDEFQYHLEREIERRVAAGASPKDARYEARRAMGPITQNKEKCRDARGVTWIPDIVQDLRYGVRTLLKNPAFTVVAVLALALGIGANTAMFSVAYGILLRPLPYPDAERLAVVHMRYSPRDFAFGTMCIRDFMMWREDNRSFEEPSLFRSIRMDIGDKEAVPEQVQGAQVTAGFIRAFEVPPVLGRTFAVGDDKSGSELLAVLSEALWRRRYGANPAVLGQSILVNGVAATVIGVMPGQFRVPRNETEVWTNLPLNPSAQYGPYFYRGFGRLKPGVKMEQAQAELNHIGQRMMLRNPHYQRLTLPVLSLRDALLGTTLKPAIAVLAGAVGLVLLIAVVNVANLLLARATVRQREMSLRLSLGAAQGRLVRQLLTESMLLAVAGGLAGLALAWGGIELVRVWNPGNLPFIDAVRLDTGALGFMLLAALLTGLLFGLAPALQSAKADLNSTLKEGGRTGSDSRMRGRARAALVVAEIALSLMLLVGAGLLLRSFMNLQSLSGGFSAPPRRLVSMLISPGNRKYADAHMGLPLYDEVLRRARSLPGVEMAAVTDSLPPDRQGDADTFQIEGQTLARGELNPIVTAVVASPGLFETLGVPLVKGRSFHEHDQPGSTKVAIVSEAFARRFFPNQEVLGKRIKQSGPEMGNEWMQIVGVAGNLKYLGLGVDTDAAYYMPFAQTYGQRMFLLVRSAGEAGRLTDSLRREVQSIDPGVTLAQISTMEEALARSVSQPRFDAMLLTLFAGIALLLAAVGIYGLIAYSVVQRSREIGVRMALGAKRADVILMVVRQAVVLAAVGIVVGLAGALALTRLLNTMVFGVGVTDALTFAAAPVGMLLIVLAATVVPALRATRISPLVALRYE